MNRANDKNEQKNETWNNIEIQPRKHFILTMNFIL